MIGRAAAVFFLTLAATPALASLDLTRVGRIEECDALVRAHPEELDSWWCYHVVGYRTGRWDAVERRLETQYAVNPANPFACFYLALIVVKRDSPRGESLMRTAADGFAGRHEITGETRARMALSRLL